jgi:broad specificity phosphatase PhoE
MLSRNIYFVRHGETVSNSLNLRQGEEGGLTAKGREQARETGKRLKVYNIDKIFCSTFERALETCDEINRILEIKNVEFTPLLCERRNPSKIVGLSYYDPITIEAINFMDKSFHDEDARWQDEENFKDLKERALKLKDFLIKNSSANTLCITHGIFLKMFLCVLLYGEKLTVKDYIKLTMFNPADNAGITVVKYSPYDFFGDPWDIVAYNDTPIDESKIKNI